MKYTITLFKFILEDTKQVILYWEVESEKEIKRFADMMKAKEYADQLKP